MFLFYKHEANKQIQYYLFKKKCNSQYICYEQIKRNLISELRKLKFSVSKKTNRKPKVEIVKIVSTFLN